MQKNLDTDRYYTVHLSKNNEDKRYRIHKLVANAFIENPNNLPEVNHIDCVRTNNCSKNLEWTTHIENVRHSAEKGNYKRYGERNSNYGNHKLHYFYKENPELAIEKLGRKGAQNGRCRKIRLFDERYNFIRDFSYIGECAEYLILNGFSNSTVNSIRSNIKLSTNSNKKYLNHYYKFI